MGLKQGRTGPKSVTGKYVLGVDSIGSGGEAPRGVQGKSPW